MERREELEQQLGEAVQLSMKTFTPEHKQQLLSSNWQLLQRDFSIRFKRRRVYYMWGVLAFLLLVFWAKDISDELGITARYTHSRKRVVFATVLLSLLPVLLDMYTLAVNTFSKGKLLNVYRITYEECGSEGMPLVCWVQADDLTTSSHDGHVTTSHNDSAQSHKHTENCKSTLSVKDDAYTRKITESTYVYQQIQMAHCFQRKRLMITLILITFIFLDCLLILWLRNNLSRVNVYRYGVKSVLLAQYVTFLMDLTALAIDQYWPKCWHDSGVTMYDVFDMDSGGTKHNSFLHCRDEIPFVIWVNYYKQIKPQSTRSFQSFVKSTVKLA